MSATIPTRRGLLQSVGAALVAARSPAALAPPVGDEAFIAAEGEIKRCLAQLAGMPVETSDDEEAREPVYAVLFQIDDWVRGTPPASLAGVAVKLRRLCDPELGLPAGDSPLHWSCLRQCLEAVERLAGGGKG